LADYCETRQQRGDERGTGWHITTKLATQPCRHLPGAALFGHHLAKATFGARRLAGWA
jgi:hypothetical protein